MKGWIEVPIYHWTDEHEQLELLGIEDKNYQIVINNIQVSNICSVYPRSNGESSLVVGKFEMDTTLSEQQVLDLISSST